MTAGLEVYDARGRLLMGAEDYTKYALGVVDLPGVYFGGDSYNKRVLESEKTLTVNFSQFDSNCKLVPLFDIGLVPFTVASSSYTAGEPTSYQVYQAVGGRQDTALSQDAWNNTYKNHVYQYFPVARNYKMWGIGVIDVLNTNPTVQGLNYWCPSIGKISYNTGGRMERAWREMVNNAADGSYSSGDTYCAISWIKMRCLVLGRLN